MPRNVLLLQGPVGPFFRKFATQLEQNGHNVLKVNLNGGDWLFYQKGNYVNYRNTPALWPYWIETAIIQRNIDRIYLFGDCRRYHRQAIAIAKRLDVEVFVFEEGYVRPNYTTLERGGVNGNSDFCDKEKLLAALDRSNVATQSTPSEPVSSVFLSAAINAMKYYIASSVMRGHFSGYEHHRKLNVFPEGLRWIRSGARKLICGLTEKRISHQLENGELPFFLAPLQVHNDTQITQHSDYECVEDFIERVIFSYASADTETHLVLKQHPYDRGYKDYRKLIDRLARKHQLSDRIHYVHDTDLPSLLRHATGTVLVNSTVGISSLLHETPVMVAGTAIYDLPGLTYQGAMDDFWSSPGAVDSELFQKFRHHLIENTQLNGSVYTDVDAECGASGMLWSPSMFKTHIQATHPNVVDLLDRIEKRCEDGQDEQEKYAV